MKYQLIAFVETMMLSQIYWLTYYNTDPNKQLLPRIAASEPSKLPPVLFPIQSVESLPEYFQMTRLLLHEHHNESSILAMAQFL